MTEFTKRTTSPFRFDIVGSFLRPKELKEARAKYQVGQITKAELTAIEDKTIIDLIKKEEYFALLLEFDERKTREAIFAYYCDKLDADIQAKVYQDMGCQNPLDKQENNVVFKSKRVQQIVQNGATTAFDIWYEWDKSLYADDEKFSDLLDYIKEVDTQTDF